MRKRRAILFDDDPAILRTLSLFFEERGYEVIACEEPVACQIYEDSLRCDKMHPCGDLMITDLEMPRMSGFELLRLQTERGCKLNIRNKAVLSGNLDRASCEALRNLGCVAFQKPCRLVTLAAWVEECERRMDLSQPLGIRRCERRVACGSGTVFRFKREVEFFTAEVVNQSNSGLCIRLDQRLAVAEVLSLHSDKPLPSERLVVRWLKPDTDGGYLAGMSSC